MTKSNRIDSESQNATYEKLLDEKDSDSSANDDTDSEVGKSRGFRTSSHHLWHSIIIACKAVVIALAFLGAFSVSRASYARLYKSKPRSCSCGKSSIEALSLGCKFDGIATAFLPPHCRDDELLDEFDSNGENPDGSWNYWADPHKRVRLNDTGIAGIADRREPYWTTQRWHISHCVYNWRKQYRQPMSGVTIEHTFDNEHHIQHCEEIFKDRNPLEQIATKAWVFLNADIELGKVKSESDTGNTESRH